MTINDTNISANEGCGVLQRGGAIVVQEAGIPDHTRAGLELQGAITLVEETDFSNNTLGILVGPSNGNDFPDDSVEDTYVAIRILAGAETGLAQIETYLFGSVVGETGQTAVAPPFPFFGRGAGDFASIASDVTPLAQFGTEPITNPHDINRDGTVAVQDILITSAAGVNPTVLPEITPFFGALGMAALAVDEAVTDDAADVLLTDDGGQFAVHGVVDQRVREQEQDDRDLAFATFGEAGDVEADAHELNFDDLFNALA